MAIYHCSKSEVQRSKGQNAVAASAYISRSKLLFFQIDEKTGQPKSNTYNFTSKQAGLAHSVILAPDIAPDWVYDREKLWNKAEASETRKNSETARKLTIALPKELTPEQNIELIEDFARECLVTHGMVADINVHYDNEDNPHAHIQMTTRKLETLSNGEIAFGEKGRGWGKREFLYYYRENVAYFINKHLEKYGHLSFVSHLSHKDRGIDLAPGIHEGEAWYIKDSRLKLENQLILQKNTERIRENPDLVFDKLSINKPVFTKEDIMQSITDVLYSGLKGRSVEGYQDKIDDLNKVSPKNFIKLYSEVLNSGKIGIVVKEDLKGRTLYTLTKRLDLEERYTSAIRELANRKTHSLNISKKDIRVVLTGAMADKTIASVVKNAAKSFISRFANLEIASDKQDVVELTPEQKIAVLNILNGPNICILEGLPGTGKTLAMKAIVKQYKKAGYTILGTATSSSASLNLEAVTSVESRNLSLWRKYWQEVNMQEFELALRSDYYKEPQYQNTRPILTNKHVLIVDEASMVELTNMDYLVNEVKKAGAKIILIGDNNQFSAIGMAGAFKVACDIAGSSKLTEVKRQKDQQQARVTQLLGEYKINEALALYSKQKVFRIYDSKDETIKALVNDYINTYIDHLNNIDKAQNKSVVICAHTNEAVNQFNHLVREKLKEAGIITGLKEHFKVNSVRVNNKGLELMKGEQILFEANDHKNGILNGEIGTVISFKRIKDDEPLNSLGHAIIKVLINKADGPKKMVNIDTRYRSTKFTYGYAMTAYKLQGASVDHNLIYYEKAVGYEAFNVMMTRHRESVRLYANKHELEDNLYNRVDLNTEEARKKYIIKTIAPELASASLSLSNKASNETVHSAEWPLWKIGLSIGVSKRTDNSLASSYIGIGESNEDKNIKTYIESGSTIVKLLREIDRWQVHQENTTGVKPNMWDHESWLSVVQHKSIRDRSAKFIVTNRENLQDRIDQTGLNYATILKHSGNIPHNDKVIAQGLNNKSQMEFDKNYNKLTILISDLKERLFGTVERNFTEVKELVSSINASYQILNEELIESRLEFEKRQNEYNEVRNLHILLKQQTTELETYRNKIIPEFLKSIYKESHEVILENWNKVLLEHSSVTVASTTVYKNPKILGKLRGVGFGRMYGLTNERVKALENSLVIGDRFRKYEYALTQIKENVDLLETNNYEAQEKTLKTSMDEVTPIELTKTQQEFLQLVEKISLSNNIDSTDVKSLNVLKEVVNEAVSKNTRHVEQKAYLNNETHIGKLETKIKDAITSLNEIVPKRVNINKLTAKSYQYVVARASGHENSQSQVSDYQIKASIIRSLFEMRYEKEVCSILQGEWYLNNNDAPMPVALKLKCQIDANKITKMSGCLLEKTIIDDPEQFLTMQVKEISKELAAHVIVDSMEKYKTRDEAIQSMITDDMLKELRNEDKKVQVSIASQIVDYKWQTGRKITIKELTLIKNLATLEQTLVPNVEQYFAEEFQGAKLSKNMGKNLATKTHKDIAKTIDKDIAESVNFAIHQIRTKVYDLAITSKNVTKTASQVMFFANNNLQAFNNINEQECQKILKQAIHETELNIDKACEDLRVEQTIHQKIHNSRQIKQDVNIGMRL